MKTKTTQATVRVALSHNYNTFEVSMSIENLESGLTSDEIDATRATCQQLADKAVRDYKALPDPDLKKAIKKVEGQIQQIKDLAENKRPEVEATPEQIAEVEKLPLYQPPVKKATGKVKRTTKTK